MNEYKAPGVYVEEISNASSSITSVETAIPAFIGYTQKARTNEDNDLHLVPKKISSYTEYEQYFGSADPEKSSISLTVTSGAVPVFNASVDPMQRSKFLMNYSLQVYFKNGGVSCWIVSVNSYEKSSGIISKAALKLGLEQIARIDEVTLLLFPDAVHVSNANDYYELFDAAMLQCRELRDRFLLMDVFRDAANAGNWKADVQQLRNLVSAPPETLKYAAAYFPGISTIIDFTYESDAMISISNLPAATDLSLLKDVNPEYYLLAKTAIADLKMILPASPAVAGIYAQTDKERGVWKSPANVNISNAAGPEINITSAEQEELNVDVTGGKSINVIRNFEGRGAAIVWGARTLAGNSNEWRYIPVSRFFIMLEESIKTAIEPFVFEPNDPVTWEKVKMMITDYLRQLWKAGALMGRTEKEAFYVKAGVNETMTEPDIQQGKMIVEIGLAVVRPAEFIMLRLEQLMQSGSKASVSKLQPLKRGDAPFIEPPEVPEELQGQINDIKNRLRTGKEPHVFAGAGGKVQKGLRILVQGPADELVKQLSEDHPDKEVHRIDLSNTASKYIGETEKNLDLIFAMAEEKGWILFFDEADALFGKRTEVRDSHDKYANMEVDYLMKKIEEHNGLVVLATNRKDNLDDAFTRRFNSIVRYPL